MSLVETVDVVEASAVTDNSGKNENQGLFDCYAHSKEHFCFICSYLDCLCEVLTLLNAAS